MLLLSDTFQKFLYAQQEQTPFVCIKFNDLEGSEVEVTSFVSQFGSINRSLSLDAAGMSIPSHSFQLKDTKDVGEFLFQLRKNLGLSFWMDKTYDLLWGFRNVLKSTTGDGSSWPLIATVGFGESPDESIATVATMGYGTPPGGFLASERVQEEKIHLYTGRVYRKLEDRVVGDVIVNSKGIEHELVEFKVCTKILASDVFDIDAGTDERSFTQVIKYGTHLLIGTGETEELKNRKDPFSATIGFRNLISGDIKSGGGSRPAGHVWYFPFQNDINSTLAAYSAAVRKVYYWDYIDEIWRAFSPTDFALGVEDIKIQTASGVNGIYIVIDDPSNIVVGPAGSTDTWTDYLAGTGTHFDAREGTPLAINPDKIDVALCMDSLDNLTDRNPVRIIHDLLTSTRFIDFDETPNDGPVDVSTTDFSAIDVTYTFDKAFSFFNDEGGVINTEFDKEISIKNVLDTIVKLTGMQLYSSAKKSTTQDRRIRLNLTVPLNSCIGEQAALAQFSTRSNLKGYQLQTDSDNIRDKIISTNFASNQSSRRAFNLVTKGTGKRILQLAAEDNPKAYWYDSQPTAQAVIDRLFNKFSIPVENAFLNLRWHGVPVELGDLAQIHDNLTKETITVEIFRHNFNLDGTDITMQGRRSELLYGPDPNNRTKRWAFWDTCLFWDNDEEGGSGTDASVGIGTKTVTLGGGETIDSARIVIGMGVALDANGTNPEHFRIAKILSTTSFELDANAAVTHSNVIWSIGNTYHFF